jgi:hypothetical protein
MNNNEFIRRFEEIIGRKPMLQDQKDKEILARVGRQLLVTPNTVRACCTRP